LKENVDYLLNRKTEFDMKLDNLQKNLAKLTERMEEMGKSDLNFEIKKLLEKLSILESRVTSLEKDVKSSRTGKVLIVE
jgi:predicted nuclease with TOPRIM domain